jgi:F0F1-type ATP synthase assembly protein I
MKSAKQWKDLGRYGTVGLELVLSILIGFFGGQWLDKKFGGGHGWLTIAGFVVGCYAGFRSIYKAYRVMQRQAAEETRREAKDDERTP